jgi:hypothetical protein
MQILFFLALFSLPRFAGADDLVSDQPIQQQSTADQLATIQREMSFLEKRLAELSKEEARVGKDDAAVENEISMRESQLQRARNNFIATASEVELPAPEQKRPEKRDLVQETQDLIAPVFDAVRRVSEKPRRIEALRTGIFYLNDRIAQVNKAIVALDRTIRAKTYPIYQHELEDAMSGLRHDRDVLQVRVDAMERKLNVEEEDRRTIFQIVVDGAKDFVKSKGKNILISFLVFFGVLWLLLSIKRLFFRSKFVHSRMRHFNLPFHTVYNLVAGLAAIFSVILTLHLLNDWFLATIVLLIVFAVFWAVKSVVHHFIHEIRLLFNLGPVKQGERVIWQGVPWLVQSLSLRTVLVNEALQGGSIALPATIIGTLFSRMTVEGEPWFPTLVGDYVLLDETVIVATGNARKHYATSVFLSKNPQNFSHGFEVEAAVEIQHESAAPRLDKLRPALLGAVTSRLSDRLKGSDPELKSLELQLSALGLRNTQIHLRAQAVGRLAPQREALRRELQSIACEAWRETSG